jgi:CRISPR-associated protein Cmr5
MTDKGIEGGRANYAYKKCEERIKAPKSRYRARVKDLPAMIQSNGLAAATAFLYSKDKDDSYKNLYQDIEYWLRMNNLLIGGKSLMESLTEMDAMKYRRAAVEVMALLKWMKRFVDGIEPAGGGA